MIIDCESYETARLSLREAFRLSDSALVEFLVCLDIERLHQERQAAGIWSDDALVNAIELNSGRKAETFDRVVWFHLTRTLPTEQFEEGLLPLGAVLDRIWQNISSIVGDHQRRTNLKSLRNDGVPNYQYNLKCSAPIHFGPFAMLIREVAFRSNEMGNHDYLALPEIIEDICLGYQERFGTDIRSEVSAALRPCIVKFEALPDRDAPTFLEPVLRYCWCRANGQKLTYMANTCYDGENTAVPRGRILNIEFVEDTFEAQR